MSRSLRPVVAILWLAVCSLPLVAEEALPTQPAAPRAIADLLQSRQYDEAVVAIDALLAEKKTDQADYLTYLKGRAQHLAGKYDDAVATFDALLKEFPNSELSRRARFAQGISLARKGDYRGAELIYKAEAQQVLSLERKEDIAKIYLEFAEAYFAPAKTDVPPDFQKALEFYTKALEVGPQPQTRVEIELRVAECQQNLGQFDQAAALLAQFIKDHPTDALVIEARFRLGECQQAQGQAAEARRTWQDLLQLHPNSRSDRLPQAAFRLSETYRLPNPADKEDLTLGITSLEAFLEKYPEHKLAGAANLRIIQTYLQAGRYEDAVAAAKKFLADERYVKREEIPAARNLLGIAYKVQGKFDEALASYTEFLAKHPTHPAWAQVQQAIIQVEYLKAKAAFDAKKYDQARELWSQYLTKYPLDRRAPAILFLFGEMKFREEKWDDAITAWKQLVTKYPGTNAASQAQFRIATTLEEKQGNFEEALVEYRKLNWGKFVAASRERMNRLTQNAMTIATERVFRSDEVPTIKLTSRNIETLTVRVYRVDLETYFRKMHLATGLEQLDISLIDPDQTFEFKVPDFQKFQQIESQIPLSPWQDGNEKKTSPSVMAVTVSSPTLEATTMVLRSDLDIIVKSSRDELFVFAQNLLTGKPWNGVKLLISNGDQVFATGETGEDGVYHQPLKELESCDDVRVFATIDGHTASNVIGLSGIGVSEGLADKGYIYTDRPTYRAGQMVHVRGVLRKVSGDRYTVAQGKKYRVDVYDNRNRLVSEAEVALSAFGSFHSNFALPAAVSPGEYRIVVHDNDRESYEGSFTVHEYQLEPVQLEITSDRTIYYRGEEIAGKIKASYYYGAPLVGKEIIYRLAEGRVERATTDDQGEVEFKFETREFRETQPLLLHAELPERSLATGQTFFLATQGFTLHVTTIRALYLAGETFDATLVCKDAEGKPLAEKLTLQVLKRTKTDGQVGEVEVSTQQLNTDEKDGVARETLKIAAGGEYVLRASGVDRFQNTVTSDLVIKISDDEDATRLRILADRHTFKVGDAADVVLHWRDKPALALVTYQGAKILDYQLVELKQGANKLQIPMTAQLAPNFELAVAVMTDTRPDPNAKPDADGNLPTVRRFHEAASPFEVARDLQVNLAYHRAGGKPGDQAFKPGDEIEVTVQTTDPQGKPLSAEVSLALIEQALLDRFPWHVPAIDEFFKSAHRVSAMRTTSSVVFAYFPQTRPINPRLLAEEDRREIELAEQERLEALDLAFQGEAKPLVTSVVPVVDPFSDPFGDAAPSSGGEGLQEEKMQQLALPANQPQSGDMDLANGPALDAGIDRTSGAYDESRLGLEGLSYNLGARAGLEAGEFNGPGLSGRGRPQASQLPSSGAGFGFAAGANADFDSLIDKITSNVGPKSWTEASGSGEGTITPFPTNLSMVVSQTEQVQWLYANDVRDVQLVQRDGTATTYNLEAFFGDSNAEAKLGKFVEQAKQEGAVLLPQFAPAETGYWNPSIVTDAAGQAKVTLMLPARSTAWSLLARGITAETLAGQAEAKLVAKKELFGQLKLPLAFTDGDKTEIQASIHNDALDHGELEVTLTTKLGGKSTTITKKVVIEKKGIIDIAFPQELTLPDDAPRHGAPDMSAEFTLTVKSGERQDVVNRSADVHPYGVPVYAIAAGAAQGDNIAVITPPKNMPLTAPRLQVLVGPTVEESLLDVLFAPATWCQVDLSRLSSSTDTAASDLMAAVALQHMLDKSRDAGNPQAAEIDARIRSAVSLLISLQNEDGGWAWGGSGDSHRYTSARVLWALSLAKQAGYRVTADEFRAAQNYVQNQLTSVRTSDYETRTVLLHAQTVSGNPDVTLVNQLYRNRQSLSPAAVVHLALTYISMDRKQTAAEVLGLLDKLNFDAPAATAGRLAWNQSPAELRATYALALEQLNPADARLRAQVDWLLAHRVGHRWSPDKATGPAMLALGKWFTRTQFQAEKYTLTIYVNDLLAKKLEFTPQSRTQTIDIDSNLLKLEKPDQRVRFELGGRGRYTYQCILGGFVPSDKLVGTTPGWIVSRTYEPAPLELFGEEIPRGFDILTGSYTRFRNELSQLPVGKRGRVELRVQREGLTSATVEEELEYLVVTEPIPAGATVIENSIQGEFERYELAPDAITFYLGARRGPLTIRYDMHGYLPGEYRTTPTVVRNAYRPDQMAVAKPKDLKVLALGAKSGDKYRLTPRELFELGQRHFNKGQLALAAPYLNELVKDWNLDGEHYQETVRMLLDVNLAANKPAEIVKWFEIIIEKFPDVELPFAKFMQAGEAYHQIGEYERSYLVFRAVIEASFLREGQVAGFLQDQGEFLQSVEVMSNLLAEYPAEPYVAAASYALAQNIYAKAPHAGEDAKLREQKITRVDLIQQAWKRLERFLTEYPDDPAADQASFSLANALLDLELYDQTIERATQYAARYSDSDYLDSFWYIIGFCHYARGEHEEALKMCEKVADAMRVEKSTGRKVESANKWRAIYILGQIHHSLDQAEAAIKEYTRVQDRFEDARQAIEYFTRQDLHVPEVTTVKPGDVVKLELAYRNIPAVNVVVYRIDLMKFSLLRRSLEEITNINLAGIRPIHEVDVKLGEGKDYREKNSQVTLPLKEEGAYLVVCRGENLYTSGMVVVSPLVAEVQEEVTSGRVRTTVRDVLKDKYLDDVEVKVIGSRNQDFVSGETDLRGIYIADGIQGTAMVIAQADGGRYAFFRGTRDLGPPPAPENAPAEPASPADDAGGAKGGKEALLDDLRTFNKDIQVQQQQELDNFYNNSIQGGFGGGLGGGVF